MTVLTEFEREEGRLSMFTGHRHRPRHRARSRRRSGGGNDMRLVRRHLAGLPGARPRAGRRSAPPSPAPACCLTAVELGPDWFAVDASAETLSKTTLGALARRQPA
jgi:hypothetical protein